MKHSPYFIIFILFTGICAGSNSAFSAERSKFCQIASYTFMALMQDIENAKPQYRLGEIICEAGGGTLCTSASVGEGICRAGGGTLCTSASIGEGICRASGVIECTGTTLEESLCKAAGLSNCSDTSFTQMLEFSIKSCGADILYKVVRQQ